MIKIINPENNEELFLENCNLRDKFGNIFPVVDGVPRISNIENYADNFGFQWNLFEETQFDSIEKNIHFSSSRFFAQTNWQVDELKDLNILEVGSGAGRFSRVVLNETEANLYSVDLSNAVSSNYKNNFCIAPDRLKIFQADIYKLPFYDNSFDKVFCFGVLQHTPDIKGSLAQLVKKLKKGGELVVDFYPLNGWYTKIHGKYIFRIITKHINTQRLYKIIDNNIDWMLKLVKFLKIWNLDVFIRFIPIVDIDTLPKNLAYDRFREWVLLDTFDMLSPKYDNPVRIITVANYLKQLGIDVTFSGFVNYSETYKAAVVRGIKL